MSPAPASNQLSPEFLALIHSDAVTEVTRQALLQRLESIPAPRFFNLQEFNTLTALCSRLTTPELGDFIASQIDQRLAERKSDGWRYAEMPPDGQQWKNVLRSLDAYADGDYASLTSQAQDEIIQKLKSASITHLGKRWFEELLAEVVENLVSHPLTLQEMNYTGFADRPGWKALAFNEKDPQDSYRPAPPAPVSNFTLPAMRRYAESEAVDAVIIGTGAGGAPLLYRLAQAGLKVVALEAGRWWNPAQEFATDEKYQEGLFWNDERLSAGADPLSFGRNNSGTGVGGTTLHYTAYLPRAHPDDFRLYSDFGVGCDWPLTYADLEPYYREAEALLGVSGPSPYPWAAEPERGYEYGPLPLNAPALLMQRGCNQLEIPTSPAPNAALSAPRYIPGLGWRAACTNRGFCQSGCSTGAKSSMDVTFIPLAVAAGAEIRPESYVTELEITDGHISGVVYKRGGKTHRQKTQAVFLCAGAIESPRLLLLNGHANAAGQVGKNFMAHPGLQVWGTFDVETHPWKGIPGALISEANHRPANADFAGGYLMQSIGVMPVTYASQFARGQQKYGHELREHLRQYNHVAGINMLGDCLPSETNFLELSDEKDERGLCKPRIHFSAGDNERRMQDHAEKLLTEIWHTAGGRKLWSFPRYAHIIGTCRMASKDVPGVVDADCRSPEIPNLYICDNSVFPSALAVNPSLTIMALSLRTANRFLGQT